MNTKALKTAIATLSKVKLDTNGVLSYVLVDRGYISASNGSTTVRVKVDFTGTGLIDLADLKKICTALPAAADINLTFDQEQTKVQINGFEKFSFTSFCNVSDYPNLPFPSIFTDAFLPGAIISKVKRYCSKDTLRPAMTGIFVDNTNVVATDAHRLVFLPHGQQIETSFIIPPAAIQAVDQNESYKISYWKGQTENDQLVYLTAADHEIIFQPVDARYPDYPRVIPCNPGIIVNANRMELINELKLAILAANPVTKTCVLDLNGKAKLSAEDLDLKRNYTSILSNVTYNQDLLIAFNGGFMLELLKDLDTEIIKLETRPRDTCNYAMLINDHYLQMPTII